MAMGAGHGWWQPLEKQRKTAAAGSSAAEAKKPRGVWPAALTLCFLAVTAVLLLQRWRAGASLEWLCQVERQAEDDRGAPRVHYLIPVFVRRDMVLVPAGLDPPVSAVYICALGHIATWWSG
jgi:hypothetical protein